MVVSLTIFDSSRAACDERRAGENILYFFPDSTHENVQLNHIGLCIAVAGLASRFSDSVPTFICTSTAVTVIHQPRRERDLCLAATLRLGTKSNSHLAAEKLAAVVGPALAAAFRAFEFRFGEDGIESKPALQDFFDRYCTAVLPLKWHETSPNRLLDGYKADPFSWWTGMSLPLAPLDGTEYHTIRALVGHFLPELPPFILICNGTVVASTADPDTTASLATLLVLFGAEISSFTSTDGAGGQGWCHVFHCGPLITFAVLCSASKETAVSCCAAEIFAACEELKLRILQQPTALLRALGKHIGSMVAYSHGLRSIAVHDIATRPPPPQLFPLCGMIMREHARCVPPEPLGGKAGSVVLRRVPLSCVVPRTRASTLGNIDTNAHELIWPVAKGTWLAIRHVGRRTIGLHIVDAANFSEAATLLESALSRLLLDVW